LRRYNATSARALACFLAAQDNPERGLCPHSKSPSIKISYHGRIGDFYKSVATSGSRDGQDQGKCFGQQSRSRGNSTTSSSQHQLKDTENPSSLGRHTIPEKSRDNLGLEDVVDKEHARSAIQALTEPVKKDHKSFIQNVFGTVAFKMVELLTPSNLEAMISLDHRIQNLPTTEGDSTTDKLGMSKASSSHVELLPESRETMSPSSGGHASVPEGGVASTFAPLPRADSQFPSTPDGQISESDPADNKSNKQHCAKAGTQRPRRSRDLADPLSQSLPSIKHLNGFSTHDIKDRVPLENGASKIGRLNGQTVLPDEVDIQKPPSAENHVTTPLRKSQRRPPSTLGNWSPSLDQELSSYHSGNQTPNLQSVKRIAVNTNSSGRGAGSEAKEAEIANDASTRSPRSKPRFHVHRRTSVPVTNPIPQSLSALSIEVIDTISSIMSDIDVQNLDSLSIKSPYPRPCLRRGKDGTVSGLSSNEPITYKLEPDTKSQWKGFIEQSLFYVLSCPTTLLKSFSEGGSLFDTQTLWYCMMRLVAVAPLLVFDSLWIAAADLYVPPRQLWSIYNSAKDPRIEQGKTNLNYTTSEAARLMSICLYAIIAAVPYSSNANELYDISRVRSYGLSTPTSQPCSSEISEMCLLHDDIFSNELALRLARRVFAAIPARRQFQEAMTHNILGYRAFSTPADILDDVLAPLDFLHTEVPPILDFSTEDRKLHEKRVPILLIDWARAVIFQEWSGRPEVPADGCLGGALATLSALHHKRKSLLLGDEVFWIDYFADAMDDMQMPIEWLSFTSDKRTVHLLDYPYLFSPSTLVTYFRAINYSRMTRSYNEVTCKRSRIESNFVSGPMMHDHRRREALFRRLPTATSKFLVLQIRRDHILADSFNQLWRREERELSRPLKIRLGEDNGEEGFDSGGVQQEFFRLAIAEALNPEYGVFTIDDRTKMAWFQPSSPAPVWKFELIGLIISLAVYNGLTLPVTFPKCLYRKLLGEAVTTLDHVEDGWPELASGLSCLLEWDEANGSVSDIFSRTYEFSVELFGQRISRDMTRATQWPQFPEGASRNPVDDNPVNARLVDGENRGEYVSDYIQWLTDISIRPQFEAFQRGFYTCLERRSLALFDANTLQSIVEGVQEIDISEMRKYARYVGWGANHRAVKDFWSIAKKYNAEEKKKLLEFVTASDRLPVGGMKNLQFVIQRNGVGDIDGHLPTSYTCFGTLLLPEYSSKEVMKDKLGMALENSKGFGFA
jgi:HECT-domain (ubiquitin-transferase)